MIKLFAFQPKGFGEFSFFVAETSKEAAIQSVEKFIMEHMDKDDDLFLYETSVSGWGTDYYRVIELEIGQVIINRND